MTAPAITDPVLAVLIEDARLLQAVASTAQERAIAAQEAVHAHLAESLRTPGVPMPAAPSWPASASHPDLLTVPQAAARAGRSHDTIGRWCRERGIGKMYGARWRVSAARLDAVIG
jgi:hypothetical protein